MGGGDIVLALGSRIRTFFLIPVTPCIFRYFRIILLRPTVHGDISKYANNSWIGVPGRRDMHGVGMRFAPSLLFLRV